MKRLLLVLAFALVLSSGVFAEWLYSQNIELNLQDSNETTPIFCLAEVKCGCHYQEIEKNINEMGENEITYSGSCYICTDKKVEQACVCYSDGHCMKKFEYIYQMYLKKERDNYAI